MRVQLSHPSRTVDVKGPKKARDVLRELNLLVEAHLVIRGDELVTEDEMLADKDDIEIRPVISGGSPHTTVSTHDPSLDVSVQVPITPHQPAPSLCLLKRTGH
jgi:sulfur carrier protein